jgi:hypothetical protein
MSKLTPTPWMIAPGVYDTNPETASEFPHGPDIVNAGGSSIAACNMYGEADAEFIVKAVNNHVGLVQALQEVLHWYGGDPSNLSEWSDCMLHARETLSAVTSTDDCHK